MSRTIIEEAAAPHVVVPVEASHVITTTDDLERPVVITDEGATVVLASSDPLVKVVRTVEAERQLVISAEPAGQVVVPTDGSTTVVQPVTVQHVVISSPDQTGTRVVAVSNKGPKGDPGPPGNGVASYAHVQDVPATVWTIEHALGFDPAGVVVTTTDGYVADGGGIQYLVAGQSLRLSFDIAIAGTARLS